MRIVKKKSAMKKIGKIIFEVTKRKNNKYDISKKMYIDKEQGKIEKIEIKDGTQKDKIYILYNEIKINTLK